MPPKHKKYLAYATLISAFLSPHYAKGEIYGQYGYGEGQDGVLLLTEKCPATSELQVAVARINGSVLEGCYVMNNRGNPVVKWSTGRVEELDSKIFNMKKSPSAEVIKLMRQEDQLNSQCRGGSGDAPATMAACEKRENILAKIKSQGWCWGTGGQFGYERDWTKCEPQAALAKPAWCKNSKQPHEVAICSDRQLSRNENNILEMYSAYAKLLARNKSTLAEHKTYFLKKTSACKADKDCINKAQIERINFYKSQGIDKAAVP